MMKRTLIKIVGAFLASGIWLSGHGFSLFSNSEITRHWEQLSSDSTLEIDHSAWGELLSRYIKPEDGINFFDYASVTAEDRTKLQNYLSSLQAINANALSADEQMAFWINLYNAQTVEVILEHYPVDSILDISYGLLSRGPWKEKLLKVEGFELSLDDVEHEILRPVFKDNRIHYAVNCASIGCPNLQPEPFTAANLETLLDKGAKEYINHPRGVAVFEDELIASSIFDWYGDDFGENESEIIAHLIQFANPDLAKQLQAFDSIADYDYDWALNVPRNE